MWTDPPAIHPDCWRYRVTPDEQVLQDEARYCSFGDTVHYLEPPKIFARCEGSFLYDTEDRPYLDLQMWYSACNFSYANHG